MAFETKPAREVRIGDKIEVDGKVLTVAETNIFQAQSREYGSEETVGLIRIQFRAFDHATGRTQPHPIWVPREQVVVVVR